MRCRFWWFIALLVFLISCNDDTDYTEPLMLSFDHTANDKTLAGDTIQFWYDNSTAQNYRWDFGDGSGSKLKNPWHVYNKPGKYTVGLTLLINGFEQTVYRNLTIGKNLPPCFTVQFTDFPKEGFPVIFKNCSTTGESYYWDFGDATNSTEVNPTHIYTKPGQYQVTLQAISAFVTNKTTKQILIGHHFDNYLETEQGFYPVAKARLLKGYFRYTERFCFQLGTSKADFVDDEIIGKGHGLLITGNGDFKTNGYQNIKAFYCYSANNELQMRKKELKGIDLSWVQTSSGEGLLVKAPGIKAFFQDAYPEENYNSYPSEVELEQFVRGSQDARATFTYNEYRTFLSELSKEKYIPLPLNAMKDYYNPEKVVVGMRHDVDCHPYKAKIMADLEREYGIRSTYYFLATSIYYGIFKDNTMYRYHCMGYIYRYIHFTGHEVGIHNDLIAVMIRHGMDPFAFNHSEIDYYNSLGIPINGTASHGSYIASATVHNFQMFSEFAQSDEIMYNGNTYPIGEYSLSEYGFDYEAYFIDYNKYYSESGGTWSVDGEVNGLLSKLQNSKPGDRIQILTHPVWWGKK